MLVGVPIASASNGGSSIRDAVTRLTTLFELGRDSARLGACLISPSRSVALNQRHVQSDANRDHIRTICELHVSRTEMLLYDRVQTTQRTLPTLNHVDVSALLYRVVLVVGLPRLPISAASGLVFF